MTALKYWDGTAWQYITSAQGPKGDKGDKGDTGATGGSGPLVAQPRVTLRYANATALPLPNATDVFIPWDTEVEDADGFHSNTVNPTRITVPAGLGGVYLATFSGWYSSNAANARYTRLYRYNAAGVQQQEVSEIRQGVAGGVATIAMVTTPIVLAAGEFVQTSMYQNSAVALTVPVNTTFFQMTRLSA
jgi:hypothetical protein